MTEKEIRPGGNGTDQELVNRTEVQITSTRACCRCREKKPLDQFATDHARTDGHRTICADCRRDYDHEHYYRRSCRRYGLEPVVEPFTRSGVVERYGDNCANCLPGTFENLDHFVPVAAGGPHTLENVRPCCRSCNSLKFWLEDKPLIREFRRSRALVGASR